MSHIKFLWSYLFVLILFIIPMLYVYTRRNKKDNILQSYLYSVFKKIKSKQKFFDNQVVYLILFWSLLVIAVMRPQYVGDPIALERSGLNFMLALDISESMEAQDMDIGGQPTDRLSAAKHVINDFILQRSADRLGLIVFGSKTFLHAPLTFDHKTLRQFLSETQIGFAGRRTAFGDALGLGIKKLLDQKQGDRIIIALTDGQNNTGALTPEKAGEIAALNKVKIYIIGLGAKRLQVDGFFGTRTLNPSVDLEEAEPVLKSIAQKSGGKYFRATDKKALSEIYSSISNLEPALADPQVIIPTKELYYWPLFLALLILCLRFLKIFFFPYVVNKLSRGEGQNG